MFPARLIFTSQIGKSLSRSPQYRDPPPPFLQNYQPLCISIQTFLDSSCYSWISLPCSPLIAAGPPVSQSICWVSLNSAKTRNPRFPNRPTLPVANLQLHSFQKNPTPLPAHFLLGFASLLKSLLGTLRIGSPGNSSILFGFLKYFGSPCFKLLNPSRKGFCSFKIFTSRTGSRYRRCSYPE